jgi:hypothetical protein
MKIATIQYKRFNYQIIIKIIRKSIDNLNASAIIRVTKNKREKGNALSIE